MARLNNLLARIVEFWQPHIRIEEGCFSVLVPIVWRRKWAPMRPFLLP